MIRWNEFNDVIISNCERQKHRPHGRIQQYQGHSSSINDCARDCSRSAHIHAELFSNHHNLNQMSYDAMHICDCRLTVAKSIWSLPPNGSSWNQSRTRACRIYAKYFRSKRQDLVFFCYRLMVLTVYVQYESVSSLYETNCVLFYSCTAPKRRITSFSEHNSFFVLLFFFRLFCTAIFDAGIVLLCY